jgi:ABC-type polysaccharide/polyol phosphate transport system ATPase subunit
MSRDSPAGDLGAGAGRPGNGAAAESSAGLAKGTIVLEGATRSFSVRADRGRTLKEMLLRRNRSDEDGPAPVTALRDVTLRIEPGETVGIVGRNGAGKSSTLRVLAGIIPLNEGAVRTAGKIVSLLEVGAGFGRDFSGRENVFLNGALHGLGKREIEAQMEAIVEFSELGHFIDAPVKTYSSGMFLRLGFAIAAHLEADILLIDEVLAVGDEAFQRKCEARIAGQIEAGATLVLVSHDAALIERTCERVVVLDGGAVSYDGPCRPGMAFYHELMGTPVEQ